jgi:acetyltransferase
MAVYCEGLRHPRRFRRVARQALEAGKPIVIYKVGSSAQGAQAALSHTASLAGSDQSFNDLCRQYGIVRVHALESLLPTANLFARYGIASGQRLGVITGSGGHAGIIPDRAEYFGLELSRLSASTREFLHGVIGRSQSVNPADFAVLGMDGLYQQCVEAIGSDAQVDALLYAYATTPEWDKRMNYLIDYAKKVSKPIFFYTLVGSAAGDIPAKARAAGIPFFNDLDACLKSIRDWQWYARVRRQRVAQWEKSAPLFAGGLASHENVDLPRETCPGEIAVKNILDRLDIRTPRRFLASSAAEARDAAVELGYPVVLKIASPQLAHKSDVGGVHLGLGDEAMVQAAFERILASVRTKAPHADIDGVLVEQMVPAGLELILGARQDPLFGSQILVGAGGIYTELLDCKSTRFTPLSEADVQEMLSEARVDGLLAGIRTGKPLDRKALILAVLRLAAFMERHGDRVQEMDINPLVVLPAGRGVYAVDGFMRLSASG